MRLRSLTTLTVLALLPSAVPAVAQELVSTGVPSMMVAPPGYDARWIAPDTLLLVPNQSRANPLGLMAARSTPDTTVASLFQQAATRKDPFVAGILSFFIPGVGSFYAGNSGHGIRHLVIHLGSVVVIFAGVASVEDCAFSSSSSSCDDGLGAFAVGYVVYLANWVWSMFTAVGDANRFNAGSASPGGRVVGSLFIEPQIRSLSSRSLRSAAPATAPRAGLQVLSLRF